MSISPKYARFEYSLLRYLQLKRIGQESKIPTLSAEIDSELVAGLFWVQD